MNHLLHPELFELIPFRGQELAMRLDGYAGQVATANAAIPDPNISIVVRTINEATQLDALLADVAAQKFGGEVELIVVDNASTDHTRAIAQEHGATVLNLEREDFTHPRSLNMGVEAASHDIVLLLSGHVKLSNDQTFKGGVRHMLGEVAGVYAFPPLANANATPTERAMVMVGSIRIREAHVVPTKVCGILTSGSAMIRRAAWQDAGGFDDVYQAGGEDTALAATLLRAGKTIMYEPTLNVHHTHGLGFYNRAHRSYQSILNLGGGRKLDLQDMAQHRPDLQMLR